MFTGSLIYPSHHGRGVLRYKGVVPTTVTRRLETLCGMVAQNGLSAYFPCTANPQLATFLAVKRNSSIRQHTKHEIREGSPALPDRGVRGGEKP